VAAGAILYVKCFYLSRDAFLKIRIPPHFKPAIGGLLVGGIGWFVPDALGTGYGVVQQAFEIDLDAGIVGIGAGTLFLIAGAKILTTSFSVGSGGSGGVFGPAVVIGGALGGGVGLIMNDIFPAMGLAPGAFALVGMAGFFGAAANVPISTIIMVSEMTGNYNLLVPSMWVCVIAYLLARRFSLYDSQLDTRFDSPAHLGNMASSVLKKMTVADVLAHGNPEPLITVSENTTARDMLARFADSEHGVFPILDREGKLTGLVDTRELQIVASRPEVGSLIVASEIAHPPISVTPDASLLSAVKKLVGARYEELVVVDRDDPDRVIGTMSRNDLVTAYNHEIIADMELK
jgi:CIC family chloride channel protein